jgi:hypothetical protein
MWSEDSRKVGAAIYVTIFCEYGRRAMLADRMLRFSLSPSKVDFLRKRRMPPAKDAGKSLSEGADKSGKVTVYYTERAGHRVVHFFSKTL